MKCDLPTVGMACLVVALLVLAYRLVRRFFAAYDRAKYQRGYDDEDGER